MAEPTKTRSPGFRGEYLWELEIATRQMLAIAEAVPPTRYGWRPHPDARSFSEVFVHVATGNFMLLACAGVTAPVDLYPEIPNSGDDRSQLFIRRNDELIANVSQKDAALELLKRSLAAVTDSFSQATDNELERSLHFFGEMTSVRRVYMRLLTHSHEHMGQLIAYLRMSGIPIPWPDWRPDRRN